MINPVSAGSTYPRAARVEHKGILQLRNRLDVGCGGITINAPHTV